jgi:hypothetical protein
VLTPPGIISDRGGGLLSDRGGSIIGNHGAGLTSDAGSLYRLLALEQVPQVGAKVYVLDALGRPLRGRDGRALHAATDAEGRYAFTGDLPTHNMVLAVELAGGKGLWQAILPKDAPSPRRVDLDLISTLTTSYILGRYVSPQADPQATLDKLPAAAEADTRSRASNAFVEAGARVPESFDPAVTVPVVDGLRRRDAALDGQLEHVKRLLVAGGLSDLGNGMPATQIPLNGVSGVLAAGDGSLFVYAGNDKRIWRVANGRAEAVVGNGLFDPDTRDHGGKRALEVPLHVVRCATLDARGALVFCDRYRVYAVGTDGTLRSLATLSTDANLITPGPRGTLLVVDDAGTVTSLAEGQAPRELGRAVGRTEKTHIWTGVYNESSGVLQLVAASQDGGMYAFAFEPATGKSSPLPAAPASAEASWGLGTDGSIFVQPGFDPVVQRTMPDGTPTGRVEGLPYVVPQAPVTVAPDGTLYVYAYNTVSKVTPSGLVVVAGIDPANSDAPSGDGTVITDPHGIAVVGETLYVADGTRLVRQPLGAAAATVVLEGLGGSARVAADPAGNVYVLEGGNEDGGGWQPGGSQIRRVTPAGVASIVHQTGNTPTDPRTICDFLPLADGSLLLLEAELTSDIVNDRAGGRIVLSVLTPDGRREERGRRDVLFGRPAEHHALVSAKDGTLYTVGCGELTRWASDGSHSVVARDPLLSLWCPSAVLFDGRGRLLLPDDRARLMRYDPVTGFTTHIAGVGGALLNGATVDSAVRNPTYMALSADGTLYIVDKGNRQIKKVPMAAVDAVP